MVPENTVTPLLADDAAEEETTVTGRVHDEEESPVPLQPIAEKPPRDDKMQTQSHDSILGVEECVQNAVEKPHDAHFAADVIEHQESQVPPEDDSYNELSQAAGEVAKLELALHIAIEKLHLPYDEASLARNAVLFVEDFAVDHELVPLIHDVVDSASVPSFELLVNIIHVLPRHVALI